MARLKLVSRNGKRGKTQAKRKPQLIASHGKRIAESAPNMNVSDTDLDEDYEFADDAPADGFDASKIIVDRDELRALRLSDAVREVAEKARGEDALAEIRSRKGGPDHVHRVNPFDLAFEDGHNPRDFTPVFMRERVARLARSIAARGVRRALDVYVKDGRMYVNGGETRWRATLHALNFLDIKVERIPVIISQGENALDRMIDQWIDNDTVRFDQLASGKLFRDTVDMGADHTEIARRIGRSVGYVGHCIKLLEMPEWLLSRVRDGTINPDTAFRAIWLASGEDDAGAKRLLAGGVDTANAKGAKRVMPKHIAKTANKGGGSRTANKTAAASETVAPAQTELIDDLVAILTGLERGEDGSLLLDAECADRLFKLANL